MKKLLWILSSLLIIGLGFLYIVKNPELPFSQSILSMLGIQEAKTPAEKRLMTQTGDIFTVENLPYIHDLTQNSSGKLAQYIKNYISTTFGSISTSSNTICPKDNEKIYLGEDVVCLKYYPVEHQESFGELGSGNEKDLEPFIESFNTILASLSGSLSLSKELSGNDLIVHMSINGAYNADPKTFVTINNRYAKDNRTVYLYDLDHVKISQIRGADPQTFEALNSSGFTAKDKNYVYYNDIPNTGIDVGSFQIIDIHYAKDKKNVYYHTRQIIGANPVSFQSIGNDYYKDDQNIYFGANIVSGADMATFQLFSSGNITAKDKNNYYVNDMSRKEYSSELQQSNIYTDTELTGEAYRIQNKLPKVPDFVIIETQVNTNNMVKTTDKEATLHITISNIGGAQVKLSKTNFLHMNCSAGPIGAYSDSYIFNIFHDITNIPGGKALQANEHFSIDVKVPLDTTVLEFKEFQGHCFLYNDNIKEIDTKNNNNNFGFSVAK